MVDKLNYFVRHSHVVWGSKGHFTDNPSLLSLHYYPFTTFLSLYPFPSTLSVYLYTSVCTI